MELQNLLETAKKAMQNAYAPYSKFKVGAALLGKSGTVYIGCNVENRSFGATICAERAALTAAISNGEQAFEAVAVVSSGKVAVAPCGLCRQMLSEFSPKMMVFYKSTSLAEVKSANLNELFPDAEIPLDL